MLPGWTVRLPRSVVVVGEGDRAESLGRLVGSRWAELRTTAGEVRRDAWQPAYRAARVALVSGEDPVALGRLVRVAAPWWDVLVLLDLPIGEVDRAYLHLSGVLHVVDPWASDTLIAAMIDATLRRHAGVAGG